MYHGNHRTLESGKESSRTLISHGLACPLVLAGLALAVLLVAGAPPALADGSGEDDSNNSTDQPPPDCCGGDSDSGSPSSAGATCNPIILFDGMVTESATDARLPGTGISWSHTRTYNSLLRCAVSGKLLPAVNGKRWEVNRLTMSVDVVDEQYVDLFVDATHKQRFLWNGDTESWDAPRDYRATMTRYPSPGWSGTATSGSTTSLTQSGKFTSDVRGCVVIFTSSGYNKDQCRVITGQTGQNTISWDEVLPASASQCDYKVLGRVKLTYTDSNDAYDFADVDSGYGNRKGTLLRRSDAYGNKLLYKYDSMAGWEAGRIVQVQNPQGYALYYNYTVGYGGNYGRISNLVVKNGATPIMGVAYVYHNDADGQPYSLDCGSIGDLIQVNVCKDLRDAKSASGSSNNGNETTVYGSGGSYTAGELVGLKLVMIDGTCAGKIRTISANTTSSITVDSLGGTPPVNGDSFFVARGDVRTTQYRYYITKATPSTGDGTTNQLKAVYEPEAVKALVDDNSNISDPWDALTKADNYTTGSSSGKSVADFASRSFTYYTDDSTTVGQSVSTPWGGSQNLSTKYISGTASEVDEYDSTVDVGLVKSETVNVGCGGCGGSGSGVKKTYFYLGLNAGQTAADKVVRLVVEDTMTTEETPQPVYRKVYGLNPIAVLLREATIVDPNSPKYWCKSITVGHDAVNYPKEVNQTKQLRMPSAHTCVDDDNIAAFLGGSDNSTELNASSGVIYVYAYDNTNNIGALTETKVKEGSGGTEYYLSATEYGDGTSGKPKRLPVTTYVYPTRTQTDTDGVKTTYAYTFHDPLTAGVGDTQLMTRTVNLPKITSGENGPGDPQVTTKEYYDSSGRLRWTKDGEGHVTYHAQHSVLGLTAYTMVDVETDELPSDITEGSSGLWVAWTENSGAVPSGFEHADDDSLQLVSKYQYDGTGRQIKATDPAGAVTHTVYKIGSDGNDETRVYPCWDTGTHKPVLPVQVTRSDEAGRVVERYAFDPDSTAVSIGQSNDVPTGSDTAPQTAYVSRSKNTYNSGGKLYMVDRYHSIPTSGAGTMSDNYYRSVHKYDVQGRLEYTIQVASGSDTATGVEQVTQTAYDALGRANKTYIGVSAAADDMSSDYDTYPTLKQVAAVHYDEATPGSGADGIGDGRATSQIQCYDDASTANNVQTIYHYNWRGQLRGVEPETAPYAVRDVDWMGRVTAAAQLTSEPTWSTVTTTSDYAQKTSGYDANRRSLSRSYYDKLGRVYKAETYAVGSTGSAGDHLDTNNYYDRDGRLVAATSGGQGATELAYDGAGRRTESRLVKELEGTHYDTAGAFAYRDPQPGSSGADDGIVQMSRSDYDEAGNVTRTVSYEALHTDTDGIDLTNNDDYVCTSTLSWYDAAHRVIKTAAYGTGTTGWAYAAPQTWGSDHSGVTRSETVLVTTYEYAAGRLQTVTDPANVATKVFQDALGRTTATVENYKSEGTYWTTEPLAPKSRDNDVCRITALTYDGLGNVLTRTAVDPDADGDTADNQVTAYTFYDSTNSPRRADLVTKVQYPDGNASTDNVRLTYALDGRPTTRTLQVHSGQTAAVLTYDYDATGRRPTAQRMTQDGTDVDVTVRSIATSYDTLSRVEKVTSYAEGTGTPSTVVNQVQYAYDDLGRLSKEYQAHGGSVATDTTTHVNYNYAASSDGVYNKGLRPASQSFPVTGGGAGTLTKYDYGTASGLADVISRLEAIQNDSGYALAEYSWNGAGRLVKETFKDGTASPATVVELDYFGGTAGTYAGFDRFGRVIDQKWKMASGTVIDDYAYGYDAASNRLYRDNTLTTGQDWKYTYDGLNRLEKGERGTLTSVSPPTLGSASAQSLQQDFGLDQVGNWTLFNVKSGESLTAMLDQTRTNNPVNELTAIGITQGGAGTAWATPVYDARGNMKTVPKPGDETNSFTCSYDVWNRLVKVMDGQTTVAEYRYDGVNRRIRKFTPSGENRTVRESYYNAGWQLLEVRKDDKSGGGEPAVATTVYERYVWSPRYIDAPVVRYRDSDNDQNHTLDETLYYATDANMNVTALIDASGAVQERYSYDPYGEVTVLDADWSADADNKSDFDNSILFCGYYRDTETGLYHVRNRPYHPRLGWIVRDPIGYGDGMSVYCYAKGNPVANTDPFGLDVEDWVPNRLSPEEIDKMVATCSCDGLMSAVTTAEMALSSIWADINRRNATITTTAPLLAASQAAYAALQAQMDSIQSQIDQRAQHNIDSPNPLPDKYTDVANGGSNAQLTEMYFLQGVPLEAAIAAQQAVIAYAQRALIVLRNDEADVGNYLYALHSAYLDCRSRKG